MRTKRRQINNQFLCVACKKTYAAQARARAPTKVSFMHMREMLPEYLILMKWKYNKNHTYSLSVARATHARSIFIIAAVQ